MKIKGKENSLSQYIYIYFLEILALIDVVFIHLYYKCLFFLFSPYLFRLIIKKYSLWSSLDYFHQL